MAIDRIRTITKSSDSPPTGRIDAFLIQYIRDNPGLRFAAIVRATQGSCQVSRRTAAWHLSRLVTYGDLTLLPNRTYVAGDPAAPTARAIIEVRFIDGAVTIHPDGSSRVFLQSEFRVTSGRIDHLEFRWPKPSRRFVWWCTADSRWFRAPSAQVPDRVPTDYVRFATPLSSRDHAWQQYRLYADVPQRYSMARGAATVLRSKAVQSEVRCESEWLGLPNENLRYGHRLTSDAHFRLAVILPEGYPAGPIRCHVRLMPELDRVDSTEEIRVAALGDGEGRQEGLRRYGSMLILSVPRPRLDRRYEVEWALPSVAQRGRWLATFRKEIAR